MYANSDVETRTPYLHAYVCNILSSKTDVRIKMLLKYGTFCIPFLQNLEQRLWNQGVLGAMPLKLFQKTLKCSIHNEIFQQVPLIKKQPYSVVPLKVCEASYACALVGALVEV